MVRPLVIGSHVPDLQIALWGFVLKKAGTSSFKQQFLSLSLVHLQCSHAQRHWFVVTFPKGNVGNGWREVNVIEKLCRGKVKISPAID